jgi:hypothetical protein
MTVENLISTLDVEEKEGPRMCLILVLRMEQAPLMLIWSKANLVKTRTKTGKGRPNRTLNLRR